MLNDHHPKSQLPQLNKQDSDYRNLFWEWVAPEIAYGLFNFLDLKIQITNQSLNPL
jgi:hypothetical protein